MPSLSIVMPSMNEEETIRICIEKSQSIFKKYSIEGEITQSTMYKINRPNPFPINPA